MTIATQPQRLEPVRYAAANGQMLAYETFGRPTDPPVMLVMGLGAQMIVWPEALCRGLARRGYYVVRFDNRDSGLSSKFPDQSPLALLRALAQSRLGRNVSAPYTLEDMAGDLLGLMDALGLPSAHLVGASMGGMIAQILAAQCPERVRSLTSIMSSSGAPGVGRPPLSLVARLALPPRRGGAEAQIDHKVQALQAIGSRSHPTPARVLRERLRLAMARDPRGTGAQRQLQAILATGDRRALLGRICCPTQVIHGDQDPLIPLEAGEDTARRIPGAKLEVIQGMGHDFPAPLVSRVERVIAQHLAMGEGVMSRQAG